MTQSSTGINFLILGPLKAVNLRMIVKVVERAVYLNDTISGFPIREGSANWLFTMGSHIIPSSHRIEGNGVGANDYLKTGGEDV